MKKLIIGSRVKFYDCDAANKDRDYSGIDEKYYPTGIVIKRYTTEKMLLSGIELGGNDVVDIQLPDGRLSKSHFAAGVIIIVNIITVISLCGIFVMENWNK